MWSWPKLCYIASIAGFWLAAGNHLAAVLGVPPFLPLVPALLGICTFTAILTEAGDRQANARAGLPLNYIAGRPPAPWPPIAPERRPLFAAAVLYAVATIVWHYAGAPHHPSPLEPERFESLLQAAGFAVIASEFQRRLHTVAAGPADPGA